MSRVWLRNANLKCKSSKTDENCNASEYCYAFVFKKGYLKSMRQI